MSVYACADLHGRYDLYEKIKNYINPEDTVYFLGDAADRGPDGWKLIKAIFKDPQFVYLKGNHEDMLVHAMLEYIKSNYEITGEKFLDLAQNGGGETFYGWAAEDVKDRTNWVVKLGGLKEMTTYYSELLDTNFVLTHAGFTPWHGGLREDDDLLWDRKHFVDPWPPHKENKNVIIVHGHTPIALMEMFHAKREEDYSLGAYWYCDNHKVNIDIGAVWQDCALLLNLDTLVEIIIE